MLLLHSKIKKYMSFAKSLLQNLSETLFWAPKLRCVQDWYTAVKINLEYPPVRKHENEQDWMKVGSFSVDFSSFQNNKSQ